jgi:hypothetical protein
METYSRAAAAASEQDDIEGEIDGAIDIEIEQAIEAAARPLAALLDGARHVEVFTAIDPP